MIKEINCSDPRFHSVAFSAGLNVVIAERTKESTKEDTCNGLGKSTLVQLIDFLLGASTSGAKQLISNAELKGWIFELILEIGDKTLTVKRSIDLPKRLNTSGLFENSVVSSTISLTEWTNFLGQQFFNIDVDDANSPSFRALIPFFIRRDPGAFLNPFETFSKMTALQKQIYNCFLLGLDWKIPVALETLNKRSSILTQLKAEIAAGTLIGNEGKLPDLEIAKVRLERELHQQEEQLKSFQVHPRYAEIEREATDLTLKIHELSELNYRDRLITDLYNKSVEDERGASRSQVVMLYKEAGLVFSEQVQKRLEEVEEFHAQVIKNRKSYLQTELARLGQQISQNSRKVEKMSRERAELLNILKTYGALNEHTAMQMRYSQLTAELEDIRRRITNLRQFESGRAAIDAEKSILHQKAIDSLDMYADGREKAISLFDNNVRILYGQGGNLLIKTPKTGGFGFDTKLERQGSQGIDKMAVFCYDITLAQLWADRMNKAGFVVHDSTIFDGVDARQRARAIEFAAKDSVERGYQYICMLNQDEVPYEDFSSDFNLDSYIKLRLTDSSPSGSLLGLRLVGAPLRDEG